MRLDLVDFNAKGFADFFLCFLLFMCMYQSYVYTCVFRCPQRPDRVTNTLPSVTGICEPLMWALGTKLQSSKAASTLNFWAISPTPDLFVPSGKLCLRDVFLKANQIIANFRAWNFFNVLCLYVWVYIACLMPTKARRRCQTPWSWN